MMVRFILEASRFDGTTYRVELSVSATILAALAMAARYLVP